MHIIIVISTQITNGNRDAILFDIEDIRLGKIRIHSHKSYHLTIMQALVVAITGKIGSKIGSKI